MNEQFVDSRTEQQDVYREVPFSTAAFRKPVKLTGNALLADLVVSPCIDREIR